MQYRRLGRTGLSVSTISFGAWAIGGSWGPVDDGESIAALHTALDAGVNFIDTADVYGDGRSERLVAQVRRERRGDRIVVATKAGRRLPAQTPDGYTREHLAAWIDRSLVNLETDALDLLQLHCPHRGVYDRPEVFGLLDDFVRAGKVRHYGVSVETVDEAMKAIAYPGVETVQIIFNPFRLKPADRFFGEAAAREIGVIARVPLASGLLTGKLRRDSAFAADDHRAFNRDGQAFDKGGNVLRRPVRPRAGGCRRGPAAGAGRDDHGTVRAALDPDVERGDLRDSGREKRGAGPRERRRRRSPRGAARDDGGDAPHLRRAAAPGHPRSVVKT
jgi:aryl-alcohol dehydrogenase-like predicted oxidoreductase